MDFIKELLQYLNPQVLIAFAEQYHFVLPMLAIVIFAETGLLAGFFLPGDSLLFIAGLMAATTAVMGAPIWVVLLVLTLAAIAGDQTGYLIGRKLGAPLFERGESRFFKPKYLMQAREFYDRHGGAAIILGRFAPIIRTFVPTVAGVVQMNYRQFVSYNIIGGVLWINSMTLLGYIPGIVLGPEKSELYIKPYLHYIALGIILLSLIPVITTVIKNRRAQKAGN